MSLKFSLFLSLSFSLSPLQTHTCTYTQIHTHTYLHTHTHTVNESEIGDFEESKVKLDEKDEESYKRWEYTCVDRSLSFSPTFLLFFQVLFFKHPSQTFLSLSHTHLHTLSLFLILNNFLLYIYTYK